jgi:hypothetical protein
MLQYSIPTPLLILHSEKDYLCPIEHCVETFEAGNGAMIFPAAVRLLFSLRSSILFIGHKTRVPVIGTLVAIDIYGINST